MKARLRHLEVKQDTFRLKIKNATENLKQESESKQSKEVYREDKQKWRQMLQSQISIK